ncbi:hypothetical protein SAMN04487819_10783 [Actinopolyspora alba]|uniref:Uncharacterized protein n=1 Tax=Actinopolyspora alba TaxID=673379 RepID=A0A1I1XIA2_9ACTN|nr:hypothetical protein SAMN04487819_10783 [Actinopolyspora alba]
MGQVTASVTTKIIAEVIGAQNRPKARDGSPWPEKDFMAAVSVVSEAERMHRGGSGIVITRNRDNGVTKSPLQHIAGCADSLRYPLEVTTTV